MTPREEAVSLIHAVLETLAQEDGEDLRNIFEDCEHSAELLLSDLEADTFDEGNRWSWQPANEDDDMVAFTCGTYLPREDAAEGHACPLGPDCREDTEGI